MLSRRQVLQSLVASSAAGVLLPSRVLSSPGQRIGAAANRAQIVDADFDVTPYLAQLKSAGVKTIGRYYDRGYSSGIGESCYHHPSKTLTKAELTAIENAGLSVYVVFQHCGAQCVNFDLQNKETAEKGRKDAEGALALARELGQPAHTPIYFAIDFDPARDSGCALPADRIWPSIDAYFDQINQVFAHTRWQVGVYGAGATCQRLKASGKAKYFWLSTSLGHSGSREFFNGGQWHLFQNLTEIKRSYARNTFDTDVTNPGASYFGQWTTHGPRAGARRHRGDRHPGVPRLRQKRMRRGPGDQWKKSQDRRANQHLQRDVPHPDGRGRRLSRNQHDRGRCGGRLRPQVRRRHGRVVAEYAGVQRGKTVRAADAAGIQA